MSERRHPVWEVDGEQIGVGWLDMEAESVLAWIDGPRTFVCRDCAGNRLLAHQLDEDAAHSRFAVVAVSPKALLALTTNNLPVREALGLRAVLHVVDVDHATWTPSRCWVTTLDRLPPGVLPARGITLAPRGVPVP